MCDISTFAQNKTILFFFYLQVFFILISPDGQRLFLFNWYWNTTTFSTFLASGGFVPGELNT